MRSLKVLVSDGSAAGSQPQPRAHRTDLLRRALLADLAALSSVIVMPESISAMMADPACKVADGAASYTVLQSATPAAGALDGRIGHDIDACIETADAVWPLALESGSVLERLSRDVLRAGRILLGSAPDAVRIVSSKLMLTQALADAGVATVAIYHPHAFVPPLGGPWVVKPDGGAGCLHTRLFIDRAGALAWIRARPAAGYVLQSFVAGKQASLSMICVDGMARVLACNQERIAMRDNRFYALGSVVNGLADDDGAFARLAQQVAAAIPGLWGYVGVDLVLTARGAVVLDVNPCLTAAYAGLHASIGCNPAGLVLDLLKEPATLPASAPPARRRAVSVDVGLS